MIKKIIYILMLLFTISLGTLEVEARSDVVLETGTYGSVTWTLYDDGDLVFSPTDGVSGAFPAISAAESRRTPWYEYRTNVKRLSFEGNIKAGSSAFGLFRDLSVLESVGPGLDTSNVTNMAYMFDGASSLIDISGLKDWNVTNVNNMAFTFHGASSLIDVDALSNWRTGTVTNMQSLFENAKSLTSVNSLENWDTTKVKNMHSLFRKAGSLKTLKGLENWNTENVNNMQLMFQDASSLTDISALSKWKIGNVTDMTGMFERVKSLTDISALTEWQVGNVTNMRGVFNGASSLTDISALSKWDVGNVKYMVNMFAGTNLTDINGLSKWVTTNVINMNSMFYGVRPLTDISGLLTWDTTNVTDMGSMFYGARSLTDISGLSNWQTGNVTNMSSMFQDASSLTDISALSNWQTGNVTNMSSMFNGASSLTDISGLSKWDVGNVWGMSQMFAGVNSLTDLNALSEWDTSNVTNMTNMFNGASSLTDIRGLSKWDMSKIWNSDSMFAWASKINTLEIGEKTRFYSKSSLANPPKNNLYTGYWVKKDGTQEKPLTSQELSTATKVNRPKTEDLTGNILGVWVWEEIPQTYTLKFDLNGGLGTIPDMTPQIRGGDKLPGTVPIKVGATFKGWSINNVIYKPGDTLQEVEVLVGGTITATAVWEDFSNNVTLDNGEFMIDIPAGQAVTVPNLPAGLGYDVYEQTPSGWILVKEVNSSGKIKTNDTQVASFVNQYEPKATSIQFKGFKYLDGVGKSGFEFELKDEKGALVEKVTSSESGGILFKPINYTSEGTYKYTISEIVGSDNTIEYDKSIKNLTVDVVKNKDGNLETSLNTSSSEIVFNNKTKPAKLTISKVVNGTNANNIPFDLVITIDGIDNKVTVKNGETLTSNDLRPGAYYSVKEINLPTGYTLNNITNQDGYLKANENINIVVTNDYTSAGSFVVKGSKVLEGRQLQPGEFSFELLDSQGVIVDKVMNDKDGSFVFNAVSLFKPGTYKYKVKEVKGTDSSIVYDSTIKDVEVVAVDNGDGTIKTTVKYTNGDIVFTNKTTNEPPQDEPETGEFSISKVVTNATDTNKDNAFDVKVSLSNSDKSALDGSYYFTNSNGTTGYVADNSVVKIKDGETITIKGLPLGAIVSIEEKVPKGYTLNNNSITSGVISNKQLALKLQNDYYAEGEFIYTATKYLRSAKLSDYKFKFEMRDGFRVVARGESDVNGNITFTPIKYSLNDVGKEFTYQITEVNDKQTKIRYDNNTYEIKVKVMDNGDGVITASTKDNSVVFRNAYDNDMPATGTYGTWIFIGVAAVLVTIVVALELKKRK